MKLSQITIMVFRIARKGLFISGVVQQLLLGTLLLLPVAFNIFMFRTFLTSNETGELIKILLYLLASLLIISWHYPKPKPVFLNFKTIYQ